VGNDTKKAATDYIALAEAAKASGDPDTEPTSDQETLGAIVRADKFRTSERRNRVLRLRRDGFTYEQIAEAITKGQDGKDPDELTPVGASSIVQNYVTRLAEQDADTITVLRQIDNERLERMFRRLEAALLEAETVKEKDMIVARQLRVLERKAKLNGLDAPQRHEIAGRVNVEMLANPDHVAKVDQEFAKRFDHDLPAADVVEEPA
jgi:DNA-binding transcriptional MerR regulator